MLPTTPDRRRIRARRSTPSLGAIACGALLAVTGAHATDVLLIPDSGNDRIWMASPVDGSILDDAFIGPDAFLSQPIQIIPSGTGTLLVTDENRDAVFEYSGFGNYRRTIAGPEHGVDRAYGICVKDGFAYFTSVGNRKIFRVNLAGGAPEVFCDFLDRGDPRGIQPFGSGFLVGNSTTDDIEIVTATGAIQPTPFHTSDGLLGINFPQQMQPIAGGNWLAAGFSAPWGIYFYDSLGFQYSAYASPEVFLSPRGCYLLDNGDLLYTGGTRIDRIAIKTATNQNIVNQIGTSFRWIDRFTLPESCTGDLNGDLSVDAADLAELLGAWGTAAKGADLDGNGQVDAADLAVLLGVWGPC
jgi:hypothetical protein